MSAPIFVTILAFWIVSWMVVLIELIWVTIVITRRASVVAVLHQFSESPPQNLSVLRPFPISSIGLLPAIANAALHTYTYIAASPLTPLMILLDPLTVFLYHIATSYRFFVSYRMFRWGRLWQHPVAQWTTAWYLFGLQVNRSSRRFSALHVTNSM